MEKLKPGSDKSNIDTTRQDPNATLGFVLRKVLHHTGPWLSHDALSRVRSQAFRDLGAAMNYLDNPDQTVKNAITGIREERKRNLN